MRSDNQPTAAELRHQTHLFRSTVVSPMSNTPQCTVHGEMAADFLRSHGIDLDAEMARIQDESLTTTEAMQSSGGQARNITGFGNVSLPQTGQGTRWDVSIEDGKITSVKTHGPSTSNGNFVEGHGALLAPSLCHPHIHIDKAYLLSHPRYSHLQVQNGDFQEAMSLTSTAKQQFTPEDLLERGQRVIDESVAAGVTHMRAFVEIDSVVGMKCLDAGVELKRRAEGKCMVQLCAFAQLPLFSPTDGDPNGDVIKNLMDQAANKPEVDVLGSTPYVESDRRRVHSNIEWMIIMCLMKDKHLDFHLDYNLDPDTEPSVWEVVKQLKRHRWKEKTKKDIVLGHCTRLTLFKYDEWRRLKEDIGDLPVSFVGLPTSDLFMMRTPERSRGTLDMPRLIKEWCLNACMGINNIGNAFTPHGSCDPLTLACNGVGVYQAGTKQDAEWLYECVSTRARRAIGLSEREKGREDGNGLALKEGDAADLVLFGQEKEDWRTRRSVAEAVYLYDHARGRTGYLEGKAINSIQ